MIPKSNCLYCNHDLFDNNPINQPEEGDYCVCIYCAEIMVFNKKLKVIIPKDKIPIEIKKGQFLIKQALSLKINLDQLLKDILIKEGHIKLQ